MKEKPRRVFSSLDMWLEFGRGVSSSLRLVAYVFQCSYRVDPKIDPALWIAGGVSLFFVGQLLSTELTKTLFNTYGRKSLTCILLFLNSLFFILLILFDPLWLKCLWMFCGGVVLGTSLLEDYNSSCYPIHSIRVPFLYLGLIFGSCSGILLETQHFLDITHKLAFFRMHPFLAICVVDVVINAIGIAWGCVRNWICTKPVLLLDPLPFTNSNPANNVSKKYNVRCRRIVLAVVLFTGASILFVSLFNVQTPGNFQIFSKASYMVQTSDYMGYRFVSISSDDWGRWADAVCVWADRGEMDRFERLGYVSNHSVWRYNTAETREDIEFLFQLISDVNHNVPHRFKAVISPMWVVGGPDIEQMKEIGCPNEDSCEYRETFMTEGPGPLARPPYNRGDLRELYWDGFVQQVWHPEYHGRSHISRKKWIDALRTDAWTQTLFENGYVCVNHSFGPQFLQSELLDFEDQDLDELIDWIKGGVQAFEQFWGYSPVIATAPHTTSDKRIGTALSMLNFKGMDQIDMGEDHVLSEIDRIRIDSFQNGYNLTLRLAEIKDELMNSQFVSLMWHSQNMVQHTYNESFTAFLVSSFVDTIEFIRKNVPKAVFVTSSELHSIKQNGYSREIWHDRLVYSNYNPYPVHVTIPDLGDLFPGRISMRHVWKGKMLHIQRGDAMDFSDSPTQWEPTLYKVGDTIKLYAGTITIVKKL